MTSPTAPSSRIVIVAAIDGTETSDDVLRSSTALGARFAGAELHLLHVINPTPDPLRGYADVPSSSDLLEQGRVLMDRVSELARDHFTGKLATHLIVGEPALEILQLASDLQADIVVVGSHRKRLLERWILGSVSDEVVRKGTCTIVVARPKDHHTLAAPEIEPPCPDCVAVQRTTERAKLWCTRHEHGHEHPRGHLHYEFPPTFAVGSMLFRPE